MTYAVEKCEYYLLANPHTTTILTDHCFLKGIFRRDLAIVSNAYVQHTWGKVKFMPGRYNVITKALSPAPLFPHWPAEEGEEMAYTGSSRRGANHLRNPPP